MPILPVPIEMENPKYLKVVSEAYQFMLDASRNPHIVRIENVPQEMTAFFERNGFCVRLKETEYLYETVALAGLRGDRYKQQRHAYNACVAQYPTATLHPYCFDDRDECLTLYDRWRDARSQRYDDLLYNAMLDDSRSAHRVGVSDAEALGLVGRVIRINDGIKGYTFGYPLRADTFCVLFEITDLSINGLAQFIYREFCKELVAAYKWVNAMDDSGLENLKRVKRSYHPCQLLPSYNLLIEERSPSIAPGDPRTRTSSI